MAHFRTVAAATDLPIMVYNNPVSYGVDITPEMFADLADEPKLVAIKESSENVRRITDLKNVCGDRYLLFCGVDDLVLESLLLGATGWVSGLVNAFPAENRLLWDLATAGRWDEARRGLPLVHAAAAPRHARQARPVHQARGAGVRPRLRDGPRPAAAAGRRGARADPGDHPPGRSPTRPKRPADREAIDDADDADRPRIQVIDSHTGGEPTRVVVAGGPDLAAGRMAERLAVFRDRHDDFRSAVVNEPRGSDVMVGALLCEPVDPDVRRRRDLLQQRRLPRHVRPRHDRRGRRAGAPGPDRRRDAPARDARRRRRGHAATTPTTSPIENVPSYRAAKDVDGRGAGPGPLSPATSPGAATGSSSCSDHGETLDAGERRAADRRHLADPPGPGRDGHHRRRRRRDRPHRAVRPAHGARGRQQNFVLCPGKAYDRSPCGTGTSAKLACLVADGKLAEGEVWRQESIIGSVFEGSATGSTDGRSSRGSGARPTSTPRPR